MHVGVSVQPLLLHGQSLQLSRLGVHGLQLVGCRHGGWDGPRQVSGVGGAKNWVTEHLVLMGGLSKQRVGEGARGVGKARQMRASGQGVDQRVNGAR